MTHPLASLARASTRERIRAAVDGNCVASIDPERYCDLVTDVVVRVRVPDLSEDLTARAAALASSDGTRRLQVKGA